MMYNTQIYYNIGKEIIRNSNIELKNIRKIIMFWLINYEQTNPLVNIKMQFIKAIYFFKKQKLEVYEI